MEGNDEQQNVEQLNIQECILFIITKIKKDRKKERAFKIYTLS